MTWTTPITWVDGPSGGGGTPGTAALFNEQIRDNIDYLFDMPCWRLHRFLDQSFTVSVEAPLVWDTPESGQDEFVFLQGVEKPDAAKVRVLRAGVYHMEVSVSLTDTNDGIFIIQPTDVDSGDAIAVGSVQTGFGPDEMAGQCCFDVLLAANTNIEVHVIPISTSNPAVVQTAELGGGGYTPLWTGYWVRDAP